MADSPVQELMARLPRSGRVEWIGVRPARRAPVHPRERTDAVAGRGLDGDRYRGRNGKRAVTLIQAEHLPVIGALLGTGAPSPDRLRRNIVVAGLNLLALKGERFRIGEAVLEGTGPCDPCSRMEAELGEGGYNAMRGHGGITARVIESGVIAVGDRVARA